MRLPGERYSTYRIEGSKLLPYRKRGHTPAGKRTVEFEPRRWYLGCHRRYTRSTSSGQNPVSNPSYEHGPGIPGKR